MVRIFKSHIHRSYKIPQYKLSHRPTYLPFQYPSQNSFSTHSQIPSLTETPSQPTVHYSLQFQTRSKTKILQQTINTIRKQNPREGKYLIQVDLILDY